MLICRYSIFAIYLFVIAQGLSIFGCCSTCSNYGLNIALEPTVDVQPIFHDAGKTLYRALIDRGNMIFTHHHQLLTSGNCSEGYTCLDLYDQVPLETVLIEGVYQHSGYSTLLSSSDSIDYQWRMIGPHGNCGDNIVYGPEGTLTLPKWINSTSMLAIDTANDFDCGAATNHIIQRNDLKLANPPANCLAQLQIKANHGSVVSLEPGVLEIFLDFGKGPGGQDFSRAVNLDGNHFAGIKGINNLQMFGATVGEVYLKQRAGISSMLSYGEVGVLHLDKKVRGKNIRLNDVLAGYIGNLDLSSVLTLTSDSIALIPAQVPQLILYDSTLVVEDISYYLTRIIHSTNSDLLYPGVTISKLNCPSRSTFELSQEALNDFSGCHFEKLVSEDSEFSVENSEYMAEEANFLTQNADSRLVIRDSTFQTINAENYDSIVLDTVELTSANFTLSHENVITNLHNYTPIFETQIRADSISNLRGDIQELLISRPLILRGVAGNINAFSANHSDLLLTGFDDGALTKIKGVLAGFGTIEFEPKSILMDGSVIANSQEVYFNYHNLSREYGSLVSFQALPQNVDILGLERCFSNPSAIAHLHFNLRENAVSRDYLLEFSHGTVAISNVDSVHVYTRCPNTSKLAMLYNPDLPKLCPARGSPVRLADGAFLHSVTDLSLPTREKPLSLQREYVSNSGTVSAFGAKWVAEHFINMQITGAPHHSIIVYWSDATATHLYPGMSGEYKSEDGVWSAKSSHGLTSVQLSHTNGLQYQFADMRSNLSPVVPNLVPVRMEDSGAYVLVYGYDNQGRLNSVREELKVNPSSSGNPELMFTYGPNSLVASASFFGRQTIYYDHDQYGRLLAVRNSEGLLEAYEYSDDRFAYSITGIAGPYGEIVGAVQYNDLHRVTHFSVYGDSGDLEYDELGDFVREIKHRGNDSQTIEIEFVHTYQAKNYRRITQNLLIENQTEYNDARQVLSQQDSLGRHVVMSYDEHGNQTMRKHLLVTPEAETPYEQRLNSAGHTVLTSFVLLPQGSKPSAMIVSSPDGETVITSYTWDNHGRILSETTGSRRKLIGYDSLGRLETVYLQKLDEDSQVLESQLVQEVTYDVSGRISSEFGGQYDANHQKIITLFTWDIFGNLTERLEGGSKKTTIVYDSQNRIVQEITADILNQASPLVKSYSWDHSGKLRKVIGPGNYYVDYSWDSFGRPTGQADSFGRVTVFTWDAYGRLLQETDPMGFVKTYEYDALDRKIGSVYPDSTRAEIIYDEVGNIVQMVSPGGRVQSLEWDILNRVSARETRLGSSTLRTEIVYTVDGQVARVQTPDGLVHKKQYSAVRELMSETIESQASGIFQTRSYERDLRGTVIQEDFSSLVTQIEPGWNTGIQIFTDPGGIVNRRHLDRFAQVSNQVDGNGATISRERDGMGRILRETLPDGTYRTFAWDDRSRLSAEMSFDSDQQVLNSISHEYNQADQVIKTSYFDHQSQQTIFVYREWDKLGRPVYIREEPEMRESFYLWDPMGRMKSESYPFLNRRLHHSYDADGNLISTIVEDLQTGLGWMMSYTWDELGRLLSAYTDFAGQINIVWHDQMATEAETLRKEIHWPSGLKAQYFEDGLGRQTKIIHRDSSDSILMEQEYTWSTQDRLVSHAVDNDFQSRVKLYTYDDSGRLTQASLTGHNNSSLNTMISYTYDNNHNLVSRTNSGNSLHDIQIQGKPQWPDRISGIAHPALPPAAHNWLSQLPAAKTDPLGRSLYGSGVTDSALHHRSYEWDAMSRLAKLEVNSLSLMVAQSQPEISQQYSYYPGSRLRSGSVHQSQTGEKISWVLRQNQREIEGLDDIKTSVYRALYNPSAWDERFGVILSDSGLIDWESDSIYFLTDLQATVQSPTVPNPATGESIPAVSLSTSLEMDPYGVPLVDLPPSMAKTLFSFQGRPHTLAGIYDFRARAYDSCTGRFLQPDPMRDGSNWTMFTGGKPTLATDPSGYVANRPLETWPDETEHGFGGNYVDVLIGEFRGLTTPGHAAIGVQYEGTYSIFTFNKLDSRPLDHHQPENYLKYDHDFRHTYSYTLNAADVDPERVLNTLRNYPGVGYNVFTNNCAVSSSRGLQAGGLDIGTSYTAQGLEHSLKLIDQFRRTHGGARTGLNPLIIDRKIHPPTYKQPVHEKLF